jgi:hypothetical protein
MAKHLVQAFEKMREPEEARILEDVNLKGGVKAVRDNDDKLRQILSNQGKSANVVKTEETNSKLALTSSAAMMQYNSKANMEAYNYSFENLKKDLQEDWKAALESNRKAFDNRFELFSKQVDDLITDVKWIKNAASKGPHDLIRDQVSWLYKFYLRPWSYDHSGTSNDLERHGEYSHCTYSLPSGVLRLLQHWRRNVKVRQFVITLRDHFEDKAKKSVTSKNLNPDSWAYQYVDIKYLQSIMDAIDDDGSGHVTIAEVNRFTEQLPSHLDWR